MNGFCTLFIYFVIYSFAGWGCETVYCSMISNKFVNRGFLNGPFCPVYGFGALMMIEVLKTLPRNIIIVFLAGTILTSALEYFTGFVLETVFNAKWWDYSDRKFNVKGRICLFNSIIFGLMCVLLIFVLQPFMERIISPIPFLPKMIITAVLIAYFIADSLITVLSMHSLNLRLELLNKAFTSIKDKLDSFEFYNAQGIIQRMEKIHELLDTDKGKSIYSYVESAKERMNQLINENRLLQQRIIKAFPNIKSTKYPEMLTIIKDKIFHSKKTDKHSNNKENDTLNSTNEKITEN
jgi:uncharacterized membrane protein